MDSAEFDLIADNYYEQHRRNIAITGEDPEYFSEYKIKDLANVTAKGGIPCEKILDFGSGIGNSIPYFRKYFPEGAVNCADVSVRSLQIARTRFPGNESYVEIEPDRIPLPDASQDIAFSACVFHHIPHEEHVAWISELRRVVKPGGLLMIYEHNPLNPLTVRAVNTCPFDVNARLIRAQELHRSVTMAGWQDARIAYRLFFPLALSALRPLESRLEWLAFGAQYRLTAIRPLCSL